MTLLSRLQSTALFTAAGLLFSSQALAQLPCNLGDDGFGGNCCEQASPNLPDFPGFQEEGSYACLSDCDNLDSVLVAVEAGPIEFFQCDMGIMEMSVSPGTPGAPAMRGLVVAKYVRTWRSLPNGNQVWRFSLNGNFEYDTSVGSFGCPIPATPLSQSASYFIGHIDYTCTNSLGDIEVALNLNHLPGCISYGPFSSNPQSGPLGNDSRSYHLVAPAAFDWLAAAPLEGSYENDSMRDSRMDQCFDSYRCLNETALQEGELQTVFSNCLCTGGGGLWFHQATKARGECGPFEGVFRTVEGFDPAVPTGLVTLPLGRWTQPGWLDGVELTTYYGYLQDQSPCPSFQAAFQPQFVTGSGTSGYEGQLFGSGADETAFVDFTNHMLPDFSNGCFGLTPGFGDLSLSTKVWSINPQN